MAFVVILKDPTQYVNQTGRPVLWNTLDDAEIVDSILDAADIAAKTHKNFPDCEVRIVDLKKKEII